MAKQRFTDDTDGSGFRRARRGKPEQATWKGFVDAYLTSTDKDNIAAYMETGEYTPDRFLGLVGEGYKVSLVEQANGTAYIASMTDARADSEWAGYTLSARGSTPEAAVAALLYKHLVLFVDGWQVEVQKPLFDMS